MATVNFTDYDSIKHQVDDPTALADLYAQACEDKQQVIDEVQAADPAAVIWWEDDDVYFTYMGGSRIYDENDNPKFENEAAIIAARFEELVAGFARQFEED